MGGATALAGGVGAAAAASTVGQSGESVESRSRDLAGRAGATLGQEDGHATGAEGSGDDAVDPAAEAREAQRLIASGGAVSRPASALMSPEKGRAPDDLTRINGIGKATQRTLNKEGFFYFDQIAGFGAADIAWADRTFDTKGRVIDDEWVAQARTLSNDADADDTVDTAAMRTRFTALSEEAAGDTEQGSGMDAGVIDVPEELDEAEREAERLIQSDEEVGKPDSALHAPRAGEEPDDLKLISGVGPKIESTLNDEGIYYFDQIANFGGRDLAWADRTLGFRGRVVRDRWVPQAKALAERRASGGGSRSPMRDAGASGNAPLKLAEAEALRLSEGGFEATEDNRPSMLLDGPEGGKADDLTRIKGIGDALNGMLNGIGVYHFRQIAAFSAQDIAWIDAKLDFSGRIVRDRWLPQAEKFARGPGT